MCTQPDEQVDIHQSAMLTAYEVVDKLDMWCSCSGRTSKA